MSTIWTPSGEYVPREEPPKEPAGPPPGAASPGPEREPTPEELEAALEQARAVLAAPVLEHIGGHALAPFELAYPPPQRGGPPRGAPEAPPAQAARAGKDTPGTP